MTFESRAVGENQRSSRSFQSVRGEPPALQVFVANGDMSPNVNNTVDLGRSALAYKNAYLAGFLAVGTNPATSGDYLISPADVLAISVFQEENLKSTLRVSTEGTIAFPLIGVVPVGGLTPQGAAQAVRDAVPKLSTRPNDKPRGN